MNLFYCCICFFFKLLFIYVNINIILYYIESLLFKKFNIFKYIKVLKNKEFLLLLVLMIFSGSSNSLKHDFATFVQLLCLAFLS